MRVILYAFAWIALCAFGLFPIGGDFTPSAPAPMCTAISGGCAEAWGLSEAPATSYSGPLFQLSNGVSTLDVGQTTNNKADMTTWSAFCGGTNTTTTSNGVSVVENSACKIARIYAEVHGTTNDLIPSVFVGSGVDCSAGGITCACPFAYEVATGLPVIASTLAICEYTLSGDQPATGITAGTSSESVIFNGAVNLRVQCCGSFGMSHAYNAPDTAGTMFQLATNYGTGPPIYGQCASSTVYCMIMSYELTGDAATFTSFTVGEPALLAAHFDSVSNNVTMWANGTAIFNNTPASALDVGTSIHLAGGGDLSQPADTFAREFALTNTAVSQTEMTNAFQQIERNFSGLLTFGPL